VWSIFNKIPDTNNDKANMMQELRIEPMSPVRIVANLQIVQMLLIRCNSADGYAISASSGGERATESADGADAAAVG
jgi:hypothetical protein